MLCQAMQDRLMNPNVAMKKDKVIAMTDVKFG